MGPGHIRGTDHGHACARAAGRTVRPCHAAHTTPLLQAAAAALSLHTLVVLHTPRYYYKQQQQYCPYTPRPYYKQQQQYCPYTLVSSYTHHTPSTSSSSITVPIHPCRPANTIGCTPRMLYTETGRPCRPAKVVLHTARPYYHHTSSTAPTDPCRPAVVLHTLSAAHLVCYTQKLDSRRVLVGAVVTWYHVAGSKTRPESSCVTDLVCRIAFVCN